MPGPVIRMAPNPRRLTVRSPPTSMVPAAAAVGCAFTRYLLLVLTVSLSCPPPARGRGGRNSKRRISRRRNNRRRNSKAQEQQGAGTARRRNSKAQEQQGAGTARRRNSKAQKQQGAETSAHERRLSGLSSCRAPGRAVRFAPS